MGAWIETFMRGIRVMMDNVAPYVGAWIETKPWYIAHYTKKSHPTWVRGLKQEAKNKLELEGMSHPTWVRGLKQICFLIL